MRSLLQVICGLEEFKQEVAAKLEEVEQKNKELVEKIGELEERIGDEIRERVEEKWREWAEEQEDRKKRERNLMLHKVKEPSFTLTNEEKKLNDVREVLKIAEKIGVELGENYLTKVYRIETRPRQEQGERDYNRMMCVESKDREKKW